MQFLSHLSKIIPSQKTADITDDEVISFCSK